MTFDLFSYYFRVQLGVQILLSHSTQLKKKYPFFGSLVVNLVLPVGHSYFLSKELFALLGDPLQRQGSSVSEGVSFLMAAHVLFTAFL